MMGLGYIVPQCVYRVAAVPASKVESTAKIYC